MPVRAVAVWLTVVMLAAQAASPARGDAIADQVRQVAEKALPSTLIVSYTIERDDGAKAEARVLGTVAGKDNLVMFPSVAILAQFALSQFHNFKVIVSKGDDLEEFDDQATLAIGDPVLSFTNLGEPDGYERVVQMTRVAARITQPVTTYLCASALGSPGTPVLTLDGRAIGIIGVARINRGTNASPKWAMLEIIWPTERFIERLRNPPEGGSRVRRPWMGVQTLTPVTKDLAEYFKLGDRRGVVIGQIIEGGPADKAGLKPEDIVLAVGGQDLKGTEGQLVENFANDIRERKAGDEIVLDIWRDGQTRQVKVALIEEPKNAAEADRFRDERFGLTVREMVLEDRIARELSAAETGVVVAFVTPAGWAADGGLQPGDIVKKVQDKDVPTLAEFKKVFRAEVAGKPKEIVLFVLRGKSDTQLLRLEPRWDAEDKRKPETPATP